MTQYTNFTCFKSKELDKAIQIQVDKYGNANGLLVIFFIILSPQNINSI